MVELKVLMALVDDESGVVGKESAKNGEWVKIFMRNVHTLLEMEDNDERNSFLDYLGIDPNFVEEQRNNLMVKDRDIVQKINTCKENLLELKQAKLNFLTMQHCISEQIPNQKKKILGVDQLTEDPSSSGQRDLVFVKFSADDSNVSIPNVKRPWLSEPEGFNFPNHNNSSILPSSQVKHSSSSTGETGSGYQQKDRKPSQNDKTEHGMEKTVQNQGQSPLKMFASQSQYEESAVQTRAGN
ncbi:hypothetical protein Tco_0984146 [Tanacetum coccineum]